MKKLGILCVAHSIEQAGANFQAALSGDVSLREFSQPVVSKTSVSSTGEKQKDTASFLFSGSEQIAHPLSPLSGRKSLARGGFADSVSGYNKDIVAASTSSVAASDVRPMAYAQECTCGSCMVSNSKSLLQNCVVCGTSLSMDMDGDIVLRPSLSADEQDDPTTSITDELGGDEDTLIVDEDDENQPIDDDLSEGAEASESGDDDEDEEGDEDGDDDEEVAYLTQEDIDILEPEERDTLAEQLALALGEDSIDLSDIDSLDENQIEQLNVLYVEMFGGDDEDGEGDEDGDEEVDEIDVSESGDNDADAVKCLQDDISDILGNDSDAEFKPDAGEVYIPDSKRDEVLEGLAARGWKQDGFALFKDGHRVEITDAVNDRTRLSTSEDLDDEIDRDVEEAEHKGYREGKDVEKAESSKLDDEIDDDVEEAEHKGFREGEDTELDSESKSLSKAKAKAKAKSKSKAKPKKSKLDEEIDDDVEEAEHKGFREGEDEADDLLSISSMHALSSDATIQTNSVVLSRTQVSVSSDQPLYVMLVDGFPMAGASMDSISAANPDLAVIAEKNDGHFDHAVAAILQAEGIVRGTALAGFQPYTLPLPVKTVVENEVQAALASNQAAHAAQIQDFKNDVQTALATAFMGLNSGFFQDAPHPLKHALFDRLYSHSLACGLDKEAAHAATLDVIQSSFSESGADFGEALLSQAFDLLAMPMQARECITQNVAKLARSQGSSVTTTLSKN